MCRWVCSPLTLFFYLLSFLMPILRAKHWFFGIFEHSQALKRWTFVIWFTGEAVFQRSMLCAQYNHSICFHTFKYWYLFTASQNNWFKWISITAHSKTVIMLTLETIVKVVIALSILYVWVFRFDNIVKEFKQYELSDLMRTIVGTSKIVLATLLVVSIWHNEYVLLSAAAMGFLMIVAQYFHFKVKNPWQKFMPSLFLLTLCIYLVYQNA